MMKDTFLLSSHFGFTMTEIVGDKMPSNSEVYFTTRSQYGCSQKQIAHSSAWRSPSYE